MNMFTISEFSKKTGLTPRTLRFYEQKGLLSPNTKMWSNHRMYGEQELLAVEKILFLKSCDLTIREIQELLLKEIDLTLLGSKLKVKLSALIEEAKLGKEKISNIENLLRFISEIDDKHSSSIFKLKEEQVSYETFKNEMLDFISSEKLSGAIYQDFMEREDACYNSDQKLQFLQAMKSIIQKAKDEEVEIGFLRGPASNTFFLYQQGLSTVNPVIEGLMPERLYNSGHLDLWFDAEYSKADLLQKYADELNEKLNFGGVTVFKSPIIEIVKNVERRLEKKPSYEKVSFDSKEILAPFQKGNLKYIFYFDLSSSTVGQMQNFNIINEESFFSRMNISSYSDVMNVSSLSSRPDEKFKLRKETYLKASQGVLPYGFGMTEIDQILEESHGMILYQEQVSEIIHILTGWDFFKCDLARRILGKQDFESELFNELQEMIQNDALCILKDETRWTFCKAHLLSSRDLVRKTIYLLNHHPDIYLEEISKFETANNVSWTEIGFKSTSMKVLC